MSEPDAVGALAGFDDAVQLTVPADAAYVSVLRTVTASLAARRDFTIEEIDDLRIAVDEASALLLPHAQETGQLSAHFDGPHDALSVVVTLAPIREGGGEIDETSFAWMVLAALADEVSAAAGDDRLSVSLRKARSPRSR